MKTIKYDHSTPFPSPMSQHTTLNFITVSAAHMCMDVGTPPGAQATCQQSPPKGE